MSDPPYPLLIVNHQRAQTIDRDDVRRVVTAVLAESRQEAELGIHFVSARRSAELNQRHLQHEGPTDVLTFDYGSTPVRLHGEIFICVTEAIRQAAELGTDWREELLRYVIHGMLHLRGYDDLDPSQRRVMKREEDRLVKRWASGNPASSPPKTTRPKPYPCR